MFLKIYFKSGFVFPTLKYFPQNQNDLKILKMPNSCPLLRGHHPTAQQGCYKTPTDQSKAGDRF